MEDGVENRKPESGGELRSILKAEFYSFFLKAGFKSKLLFWFSIILFPTSSSPFRRLSPTIYRTWIDHNWVYFNFNNTFKCILLLPWFGNAVWVGENLWKGRLAQGGQVAFVVRWGFSVGIMRVRKLLGGIEPIFLPSVPDLQLCLLLAWSCTIHLGIWLVALSF